MTPSRKGAGRLPRGPDWATWTDEELLHLRFKDLQLQIAGTWIEHMVARLHGELEQRGLTFRPHCWLSNEWFSPDGIPGIAIPFYLAHPRLMDLERKQMLEVEGGSREWCMRILRHEAGHAIDTAFRLRRRRAWQRTFGLSSVPYPTHYRPKPNSREYVLHLEWWYAQSHPLEDFAETFAVWLRSGSRCRAQYAGWPALKKLDYVDELMAELEGLPAPIRSRAQVDPLPRLSQTLGEHYENRRSHYGVDLPDFYDQHLVELFTCSREGSHESATAFLMRNAPEMRGRVSKWTGLHPYTVEQFMKQMITRSRALDLRVARTDRQMVLDAVVVLTVQVLGTLRGGGYRIAL